MSDTDKIEDILGGKGVLKIPEYQRGYQWDETNVADLFRDIRRCSDDESNHHYFGTIVTSNVEDNSVPEDVKHVVDGQQRLLTVSLFIKAVNTRMRHMFEKAEDELDDEQLNEFREPGITILEKGIDKDNRDLVYDHHDETTKPVFLPADKHRKSYIKIINNKEKIVNPEDVENIEAQEDTISQKRIRDNYCTILEKLDREIYLIEDEEYDSEIELHKSKVNRLASLKQAVLERFMIMEYEIDEDTNEEAMEKSSLYFECINDRGTDLYEIDKVKSYILYRHSNISDEYKERISKEEIHDRFVSVEEYIHEAKGNYDTNISDFMLHFFYMFTGKEKQKTEENIVSVDRRRLTDVSKRIKYCKLNLPVSDVRDDEDLIEWIEFFTEKLVELSKSYRNIKNPTESNKPEVLKRRLYFLDRVVPTRQLSFRLALEYAYSDDHTIYKEITEHYESLIIRVFEILKVKNSKKTQDFISQANKLFWTKCDKNPEEIQNTEAVLYDDIADSRDKIISNIEQFNREDCLTKEKEDNGKTTYVDEMKSTLKYRAVLNGYDEANYMGMRNDEFTASYILYIYAKKYTDYYDMDIKNFNSRDMDFFHQEDIDRQEDESSITYEHIWSKKYSERPNRLDDMEKDTYKNIIGRIGNGLTLTRSENSIADTKGYAEKLNDVYKNENLKMIDDEFPDSTQGWSEEIIDKRSSKIADFVSDKWDLNLEDDEEITTKDYF